MANDGDNNPPPEGINILNCSGNDNIYIINEVLNFYQRKLRVLKVNEVKNLSHHVFDADKLKEARKVLKDLWDWKKLVPIPEHKDVAKRLAEARLTRGTNVKLANDIIDFLQIEDSRLGITFLTQYCEEIPSSVHEMY